MKLKNEYLAGVYETVCKRNAGEKEFLQAVGEVLGNVNKTSSVSPSDCHSTVHWTVSPQRGRQE